jgi:hypothetical protein
MALPPLEVGAVHETVDEAFTFEVAETSVGAPGVVHGFAFATRLARDVRPALLVAVTVNE